ncbi:unnamed protein product [Clavelina lepadiformis]|uniref:Uncharacterized protein n=2 Tax=Clavelina lepadiformis TaxID=159417 RepID=A0ABP0F2D4_CLALP
MSKEILNENNHKAEFEEATPFLNHTYHDVEIKVVKIVNPSSTTVKFKEHLQEDGHSPMDDVKTFKYIDATKSQMPDKFDEVNGIPGSPGIPLVNGEAHDAEAQKVLQGRQQSGPSVCVFTVPLDQNPDKASCRAGSRSKSREGAISVAHNMAKEKYRDNLQEKKQQIKQTFIHATKRQSSGKLNASRVTRYYEVAPGVIIAEQPENNDYGQKIRSGSVPNINKTRLWTGHKSASSRAWSSISSRWKVDEPVVQKPNMFVKLPFKQVPAITMDNEYKMQDDVVLPGEDLRATTAFALSRIRQAIKRMPSLSKMSTSQGRLLKARLKPLRPVALNGPSIYSCCGVQPEFRKQGYSPSPSRQRYLKEQFREACDQRKNAKIALGDEYERRLNANSSSPDQSIHRTSPEPEQDPDYQNGIYPYNIGENFEYNNTRREGNKITQDADGNNRINSVLPRHKTNPKMEEKFNSMNLDGSVIY